MTDWFINLPTDHGPPCTVTCLTSSVLTLSAISCDRFIAILYPLQARFRVTKHRTGILIILIWITSAIVSLPFLFMRKLYVIQVREDELTTFSVLCKSTCWPVSESFDPLPLAQGWEKEREREKLGAKSLQPFGCFQLSLHSMYTNTLYFVHCTHFFTHYTNTSSAETVVVCQLVAVE